MIGSYEYGRDKRTEPLCWCTVNDSCPPHFHSSIEFTYVIEGTMKCMINGKQYILHENEFLFSPSYTLHQYERTSQGSKTYTFTAPLDSIPSFAKIMSSSSFVNIYGKLPEGNDLVLTLERLVAQMNCKPKNSIHIKGLFYTVFGILIDTLGLEPIQTSSHSDFTRDVLVYIDEHFLEELNAQTVADIFGYSKSHFLHIFTANFGFSFAQYINIMKCRHAGKLLLNEKDSLIDIAMNSGFNNMRSFYRNFKEVFGLTPSEYLEDYKENLYNR